MGASVEAEADGESSREDVRAGEPCAEEPLPPPGEGEGWAGARNLVLMCMASIVMAYTTLQQQTKI